MKAKQYVELFKSWEAAPPTVEKIFKNVPTEHRGKLADREDLICHLASTVLNEYYTIREARKAKTEEALAAILRELDQKWRAICNRLPGCPPEFFKTVLQDA